MKMIPRYLFFILFLWACNSQDTIQPASNEVLGDAHVHSQKNAPLSAMEQFYQSSGLIDIQTIDSTIQVKLMYATKDNFLGKNIYGDIQKCYLLKDAAIKLSKSQQALKKINPAYSLLVTDGARPFHIQKLMWDSVKLSTEDRLKYLSNPRYGSVHNYGAAVDITIVDKNGKELDMGTPIDHFSELSFPVLENQFLKQGKLTQQQIDNRKLLRKVMSAGGYINIPTEWWHFNAWYRRNVIKQYALLDMHKTPVKPEILPAQTQIMFRIQIFTSSTLVTDMTIFNDLKVDMYQHDTKYKYVTGSCKDLQTAYFIRDKIRTTTNFTDAFVVAFNGKQRIGLQEAIEMMQ